MHQPAKWWMGLLPVAAAWFVGDLSRTSPVEADLLSRSRDVVASVSPDTASALNVGVAGRDILIEGPEFGAGQGATIAQAVADAYGVRYVVAGFASVPAADPFVFSATRAGAQMVLAGAAPSPAIRARLVDVAKAATPGGEVIDRLAWGVGAPEGFEAIAARGVADAGRLDGGVFSLTGGVYSIAGAAASSAIYEAAIASTQQLPAGAKLGKVDVLAPEAKPFLWSATSDGLAATIGGVAPSIEARSAIARSAGASLPGKMVVDQMAIARGAPTGDFAAVAGYALGELGKLAKGRVSISDGAYSIVGEAGTSEAYEAALAATKRLPEGLTLARADIAAPVVKPFVWSVASDGKTVTLAGVAPTGAIRATLAEAAAKLFPGKSIVNDMGIARGAPEGDFVDAGVAAMTELGRLADGKAILTDNQFSISGQGPADATNAAIGASAKAALPAPFAVAAVDIREMTISPYVFRIEKGDGKVRLSGYAPDDRARRDLLDAAGKAFFNDTIEDALKAGKGAPANMVAALKAAFGPMARLESGSLSLSDATVKVDGRAIYAKAGEQIAAALGRAFGAGFKLDAPAVVARPLPDAIASAQCQPLFSGLLAKGRVLFDTGSTRLSAESLALLDHLVGVAQRCREADVEVSGHTDSVGSAESNLALSKRRAQAVVDYLTESGLDTSRIQANGYGETRPVASNDTPEGREQNRRIEFLVK